MYYLWQYLTARICGKIWWPKFIAKFCGKIWWQKFMAKFCGKIWWQNLKIQTLGGKVEKQADYLFCTVKIGQ